MYKLLSLSVAMAVALLLTSGCCTPSAVIGSQPVPITGQHTDSWCWAASGEMTMNFLGANPAVAQCDEANRRFGKSDCCNSPTPAECINGGWPEYDKYGFTASVTSDAPLSFAEIQNQIYCRREPFAFSWHWSGGGGHMMVVSGYLVLSGQQYVTINDPEPWMTTGGGSQRISLYTDYVSGSGYTHWNDYYNITKK
ncbi:MAG TPA: papain-like cysteine protease family protein [Thermoanaerobaculia bacterium]